VTSSQAVADSRKAGEVLAWSQTMVEPELRRAVDRQAEPIRRITWYHLGWWDESGVPTRGGGGKAVRPALTPLSAEAVGGSARSPARSCCIKKSIRYTSAAISPNFHLTVAGICCQSI